MGMWWSKHKSVIKVDTKLVNFCFHVVMNYNFVFAFTPSVPPPTHVGSFDVTTSTTHLLDKLCFYANLVKGQSFVPSRNRP